MSADIITRCQWLETKCRDYTKENEKLRQRVIRLEKMVSTNSQTAQLYAEEVDHCNGLLKQWLGDINKTYQTITDLQVPTSYKEFYRIFRAFKDNFLIFVRTIKNYIDSYENFTCAGPIFLHLNRQNRAATRDKIATIQQQIVKYLGLLGSKNWSENVDTNTAAIKKDIVQWLTNSKDILVSIYTVLEKEPAMEKYLELEDCDFIV